MRIHRSHLPIDRHLGGIARAPGPDPEVAEEPPRADGRAIAGLALKAAAVATPGPLGARLASEAVTLPVESLERLDLYLVKVRDETVRAHLATLPDYESRREHLGRAAALGVLAIEAARPIDATRDVEESFNEMGERLEKLLERHSDDLGDKVGDLDRGLDDKIDELERMAENLVRIVEARKGDPNVAGPEFEGRIVHHLQRFAAARGDRAEGTGTKKETAGRQVGDAVYSVGGVPAVALEIKDRPCTRSGEEAYFLPELEEAMANRGCAAGIVVACLEDNVDRYGQPSFPCIQEFPGDRFVVLVDRQGRFPEALDAALHLVLGRLPGDAKGPEVDLESVRTALDRTLRLAARVGNRARQLDTVVGSLRDLQNGLREDQRELEESLGAIRRQLEPAA